jgi:type VI protein secretion system component VasF
MTAEWQPSTRNTKTSGGMQAFTVICLIGVLVLLVVVALVLHGLFEQAQAVLDQLDPASPSSCIGGAS